MATRVIDDTKLNNIAVAIQAKDSGGQMTVDEMPTRIQAIPTGSTLIPKTITQNGVYNASDDNADGYDVVEVNVPERNTLDELYANTLEIANIPSATSIGEGFFYNRSNLRNVIMPNVTSIGSSAFSGCSSLALTALPDGVTSIDYHAFQGCSSLALTALPDGVTSIGMAAFQSCSSLALTALPDGVTSIGSSAFQSCSSLALIVLPDGVTSIGGNAFRQCKMLYSIDLTAFTDPQAIPTLANANAFYDIPSTAQFIVKNQEMYDVFTTATNWSTHASKFVIEGA